MFELMSLLACDRSPGSRLNLYHTFPVPSLVSISAKKGATIAVLLERGKGVTVYDVNAIAKDITPLLFT